MENKVHKKVADTFNILNDIDKVEVNQFFKQKVLQKLSTEKEEKEVFISWFTPQLQLATLVIVLLLNIGTVFYTFTTTGSSSDIKAFAQEYSLQSNSNSLLN